MDIETVDRKQINTRGKWDFLKKLEDLPKDKAALIPTNPDKNISLNNIRTQINNRFGSGVFSVNKYEDNGEIKAVIYHQTDHAEQDDFVSLNGNNVN